MYLYEKIFEKKNHNKDEYVIMSITKIIVVISTSKLPSLQRPYFFLCTMT